MKKLTVIALGLVVIVFGALRAVAQGHDLAGSWQGTLTAGANQLRIIMKISKDDKGALAGSMYSIDQGGQPIGIGAIAFEGSSVKLVVPAIGGTYEGAMASDGNSIKGTWTQGPNPLPLVMTRATPETAWEIPAPPAPPKPYANPNPVFAVATVKPSNPDAPGKMFRVGPGIQFSTLNTTVADMIGFAYGIHPKQLVNAPDWLGKDKFDILAKPDGDGMPNDKQWKTMVQKLLVDRFQLTFHNEKQDLSVYAIVLGKDGAKLTKSQGDPNGLPTLGFRGLGDLVVRNANMVDFAGLMQGAVLDKPVVDQTGLQGRFDFQLKWTPDQSQFESFGGVHTPPAETADAPPDLYTAIQQQIGLKIETTKAPVDVMVLDKVAQPSAN
jgi:uncharacterized protein (TIGR03435 family)